MENLKSQRNNIINDLLLKKLRYVIIYLILLYNNYMNYEILRTLNNKKNFI